MKASIDITMLVANFFTSVLVAVITALLAVRLALKRFYVEKWWERKCLAYTAIMESLHNLRNHADTNLTFYLEQRELSDHQNGQLTEKMQAGVAELRKQTDIGSFVISDEAVHALRRLMEGLDDASHQAHPQDYLEVRLMATDACLEHMRCIARKDLRLASWFSGSFIRLRKGS